MKHSRKFKSNNRRSVQRMVRRRAALADVKRTLNAIDFDAMFQRIRDNLNVKAGWNAWT